jgi:chaperonin GroES
MVKQISKKLSIKPLGDRIVVVPIKEAEKTKSGIILPETADKEKPVQGKVVAIGSGDKIKKSGLKKGDEVAFEKYAGTEFKIGDIEYKILKEDEILAILE